MKKLKLQVEEINEISRQMVLMENLGIGFADFEFNMNLGLLRNEVQPISKAFETAHKKTLEEGKKQGSNSGMKNLDKLLAKTYEINMPPISVELLKTSKVELPVSVISMFLKYTDLESGKKPA